MFFDAAVKWLATTEVLFVVADSAALNASDTAMKTNQSTVFAYDPTMLLINGQLVPGRRVGWFGQRAMMPNLTASGWNLFDAAALWAGGWTQAPGGSSEIPPCTGLFCDNFEDADSVGWTVRQGATSDFSVVRRADHPVATGHLEGRGVRRAQQYLPGVLRLVPQQPVHHHHQHQQLPGPIYVDNLRFTGTLTHR